MRFLYRLLPVALGLVLSSCGIGYRKDWAAAKAAGHKPGSVEGAWEGSWHSLPTGHTGKLWCIVKQRSGEEYDFRYHATWGKIFQGSFSTRQTVQGDHFSASHTLGKRGLFQASGTLTPEKGTATYQAPGDHGSLELHRPAP